MFETYDTTEKAYVEHSGEYYDLQEQAWVPVPSAMTYDTIEKAWIERMYAGWLAYDTRSKKHATDILEISPSKVSLTVSKSSSNTGDRSIKFTLTTSDIKVGDIVEFDVNASYYAGVVIWGGLFTTEGGVSSWEAWRKTKQTDEINGRYSGVIDNVHLDIKRITYITVELNYTYAYYKDAYAEVSNLKINGKKYGFTE